MSKRFAYQGCDIKVGEWGTTVHGRDLRHAITKLDEHVQEKYRCSLPEYLQNGNGKRIHRVSSRPFLSIRRSESIDPIISRITRRRRK
jgi:hypothetical protein